MPDALPARKPDEGMNAAGRVTAGYGTRAYGDGCGNRAVPRLVSAMNRMPRHRFLIAASLSAALGTAAFAASAQGVAQPPTAAPSDAVANDAQAAQQGRQDLRAAECLTQTGTRIRTRDAKTGKVACQGPGRSYSRDELERTGQVDMADALRRIDPSIR